MVRDGEDDNQEEGEFIELEDDPKDKKGAKDDKAGADGKSADVGAGRNSRDAESDDDADEGDSPAPDSDRLAVEGQDVRARRRLEKKERRTRQRAAEARSKKEIQELRDLAYKQGQVIAQLQQRGNNVDAFNVDQQLQRAIEAKRSAELNLARAIKANDGVSAANATAQLHAAADAERNLSDARDRMRQQATARPAPATANQEAAPSKALQKNYAAWTNRNDWFDPELGDDDSRVAYAIESGMSTEGLDPDDPDYWDELDDRLREKLPHRYEDDGARRTVDRGKTNGNGSNGQRRTPPVRGGSQNGKQSPDGRKGVFVSKERIEALKSAGIWDNPEKRQRYLKSYQKWDRENADLVSQSKGR